MVRCNATCQSVANCNLFIIYTTFRTQRYSSTCTRSLGKLYLYMTSHSLGGSITQGHWHIEHSIISK